MPSHCQSEELISFFFFFVLIRLNDVYEWMYGTYILFGLKVFIGDSNDGVSMSKPCAMTSIEIMKNAFCRAKNKEVYVVQQFSVFNVHPNGM